MVPDFSGQIIWVFRVLHVIIDMFILFPYKAVGFTESEWDKVPRVKKCIIRSYFLNNRSVRQAAICDYYATDDFVDRTVRDYGIKKTPPIGITVAGSVLSC